MIGVPRRPNLVTVKAAAKYLGVTERTVRRMIDDGRLTGYRLEGSKFIRVDLNEVRDKLRPI
jgi:excisionase family DNA binding protein